MPDEPTQQGKERALAEEILSDARRQADRKVDRAKKRAERLLRNAGTQAEEVKRKADAAARERAERQGRRVLADLPHQEQVRTLRVKEEVVGRIFDEALEAARTVGEGESLAALVRLSRDAAAAMNGDRFMVELSPADADRFGRAVAERLAAEGVAVEVAPSADVPGGVVVRTGNGRQMVDNTFATRVQRVRPRLRAQIAEQIFGDEAT